MHTDSIASYKQQFRVGAFIVDPGGLSIAGDVDAEPVRLKPKAMAVLVELARQPGVTVTRDELLDRVWKSVHVTPGVVGHAITALRRAFGDPLDAPTYIETIPRIGYRLLLPVEPIAAEPPPPLDPAPLAAQVDPPVADRAGRVPAQRALGWRRVAVAVALAAAAVLATLALRQVRAPAAEAPLQVRSPQRLTFGPGSETSPRLDAAGNWLVYSRASSGGGGDLVLQSAHGTRGQVLAAGEQAQRAAWSADGRRLAYVRQDEGPCELRLLGIEDGARERIFRCAGAGLLFFDWNPVDARTLAYASIAPGQGDGSRISLLVDDGGWTPRALAYAHQPDNIDLEPRYSPDGQSIAFRRGANPSSDIYVMSARGGAVTRLTRVRARISGFDWLPDGSALVFSSDHDGRQALHSVDLSDRRVHALGIDDASYPDVANRAWSMAYQLDGWRSAIAEVALRGTRSSHRLVGASSGRDRAASVSPDDARVAFVSDRDGSQQLWLLERATGAVRRLTAHRGANLDAPAWAPDGRRLLYVTRAQGRHQLWEVDVASAASHRLVDSRASLRNAVYASDGRSAWYTGWDGAAWRLHRCVRAQPARGCVPSRQPPRASRVERGSIGGVAVLVLLSPRRSGELDVVAEAGLAARGRVRLPANDGWNVVGDEVWFFPGGQPLTADGPTVRAVSLRDGRVRTLASLPALRVLRYSAPQATRDGTRLFVPVVLEDSTDIAYARLARSRKR